MVLAGLLWVHATPVRADECSTWTGSNSSTSALGTGTINVAAGCSGYNITVSIANGQPSEGITLEAVYRVPGQVNQDEWLAGGAPYMQYPDECNTCGTVQPSGWQETFLDSHAVVALHWFIYYNIPSSNTGGCMEIDMPNIPGQIPGPPTPAPTTAPTEAPLPSDPPSAPPAGTSGGTTVTNGPISTPAPPITTDPGGGNGKGNGGGGTVGNTGDIHQLLKLIVELLHWLLTALGAMR